MPAEILSVYVHHIHDRLLQTIICAFSEEMKYESALFGAIEVPAAADLLAVLCEHYAISPGVTAQTVRRWYTKYMAILPGFLETGYEENPRHTQILAETFERLAVLAEKYPPFGWKEDE
jgi:hypothetical protein